MYIVYMAMCDVSYIVTVMFVHSNNNLETISEREHAENRVK